MSCRHISANCGRAGVLSLSKRSTGISSDMLARTFAALRHRNYRLYFIGMVISLTGGWMQIVAAGWLVLRVTASPLLLGVITAMETLPALFFSLLAGALADRIDKRRFAIIAQTLLGVQGAGRGVVRRRARASFL